MTSVSAPRYLATSNLTGTAPWYVGCVALPATAGNDAVWTVLGPVASVRGNGPQHTEATFNFPDPGSYTINLTITNQLNGSDVPFTAQYTIVVTPNPDANLLTGFSMTKAALQVGLATGFTVTTDQSMLPCFNWDYGDESIECNHNASPNHTYNTPKIITGKVTMYYMPASADCDCSGTSVGSKDFSLLVYES